MIIYKYFPKEGALKALENHSVVLKCPTEYNDPFDCLFFTSEKEKKKAFKLFINYMDFKDSYRSAIIEKKQSILPKLSADSLNYALTMTAKSIKESKKYKYNFAIRSYHWLASLKRKDSSETLRPAFDKLVDETMSKIRNAAIVSCFSLDPKSILMWAHYGEKHQSACFEYEVDDNKVYRPVKYRKKPSYFPLTRVLEIALGHDFLGESVQNDESLYEFALEPLFNKSKVWAYEKEVRCVFSSEEKNDDITFGKPTLYKMPIPKRIILGCQAPDSFVRDVKEKAGDIPCEKLVLVKGEYSLAGGESLKLL